MAGHRLALESFSTEDFFRRVMPATGYYVIAWKEGDFFRHKVFEHGKEAINAATQLAFQRKDAYYAMAAYKQGFHDAPDGRKVLRTQENVRAIKALWVDIDCGKGGYETQPDAIQALGQFSKDTGIPLPSLLVSSGNGLHGYWSLTRELAPHEWQGLATALKDACLAKGLKIDPGITADSARILRLPGTYNYKRPKNPQKVELFYALDTDFDPDALRQALATWMDSLPPRAASDAAAANAELGAGLETTFTPTYMKHIVQRCKVMQHVAETHGASCSEPLWTATLQLAKVCEDGEDWIHALSDGHPGYDAGATEEKFKHRLRNDMGGTRCKTFEQHMPSACATCPHKGHINSPVAIGKDKYDDPLGIPYPWRLNTDLVAIELWTRHDEHTGDWEPVFLFAIENMVISECHEESGRSGYIFEFSIRNQSRRRKVSYHSALIGDNYKSKQFFGEIGFPLLGKGKPEEFGLLMSSWLDKLAKAKAVRPAAAHLGWQDDGSFCLGHGTVTKNGVIDIGANGRADTEAVAFRYFKRGTLEGWQKGANHIAKQPYPELAIIMASAFAAPLMQFTGNAGFLLSVVSTKSGVGKSTAMAIAQGVWGDPEGINSINDTENAVSEKLGYLSTLPAYWDEIKGRRAMDIMAHMAFRISEGRTKARLSPTGKMMPVRTWHTILLAASNSSLMDHIKSADLHTDAGILRVFEIEVDIDHTGDTPPAPEHIFGNFGHAGEVYAQALVKNRDTVQKLVAKLQEKYRIELAAQSRERFWLNCMAVLVGGAMLAKQLRLVDFDIPAMENFLKDAFLKLRVHHASALDESSALALLVRYLNEHFSERLVTNHLGSTTGVDVRILYLPARNTPIWQLAREDQTMVVQIGHFKDWLRERGYSYTASSELEQLPGVLKRAMTIGGRTEMAIARCACWEVNMALHPSLQAMLD